MSGDNPNSWFYPNFKSNYTDTSIWKDGTEETARLDGIFRMTSRSHRLDMLIDLYTVPAKMSTPSQSKVKTTSQGAALSDVQQMVNNLAWPPCIVKTWNSIGIKLGMLSDQHWKTFLGGDGFNLQSTLKIIQDPNSFVTIVLRMFNTLSTNTLSTNYEKILLTISDLLNMMKDPEILEWFKFMDDVSIEKKNEIAAALNGSTNKKEALQMYVLHLFNTHFTQIGDYIRCVVHATKDANFFKESEVNFDQCYNAYKILVENDQMKALIRILFRYAMQLKYVFDKGTARAGNAYIPHFTDINFWRNDRLTGFGRNILFDLIRNPVQDTTIGIQEWTKLAEWKEIRSKFEVTDNCVEGKNTVKNKTTKQTDMTNLFASYTTVTQQLKIAEKEKKGVSNFQTQLQEWHAGWLKTLATYYDVYDTITLNLRTKYMVPDSDQDFIASVLPAVRNLIDNLIELPGPTLKNIETINKKLNPPKVDTDDQKPKSAMKATLQKTLAQRLAGINGQSAQNDDPDGADEGDWNEIETNTSLSLGLPQLVVSRHDMTGMTDATGATHDATRNIHLAVTSTGAGRAIRRAKRSFTEKLTNEYPYLFGKDPNQAFDTAMRLAMKEHAALQY